VSGIKNDAEKPDMSLLSPFALEEIAKVMTFGAKKYSANNWRNGFKYTRLLAAVMRHLSAYQRGEAKDPETGLSHLAHASCGLMMLLEFEQTGAGENDVYWQNQPKKPSMSQMLDEVVAEQIANETIITHNSPTSDYGVRFVQINNSPEWYRILHLSQDSNKITVTDSKETFKLISSWAEVTAVKDVRASSLVKTGKE
jgi:Domain of unknown function (DUF5664)